MNHSKSESLYGNLANKLNEIIPVDWDKIYLRSEVEIGSVELTYWFVDSKTGECVQNFDMASKYGINRKIEKIAFSELTEIIEDLQKALSEEGNQPFTVFSFIVENTGKFNVKYEYINLEESSVLKRREIWAKEHLCK